MTVYHLAIDIGASGGRHILGYVENGKLVTEEVYRFENGMKKEGSSFVWDTDLLLSDVKKGIKKCGEIGKIPATVAIDTWGVDYVLLDKDEKEILPVYAYRDERNDTAMPLVESIVSYDELYAISGMQRLSFNTVYQLYSDKINGRLENAEYFLMIPDYLSYKLTGVMNNEYTEASTTGMLDAEKRCWSEEIIERLGYPKKLFGKLSQPSSLIGSFSDEMKEYAGFDSEVICCPSHDTASAVAACPLEKNSLYISSGTWSLIGMENDRPVLTDEAKKAGFTNEGGIYGTIRFLRNYMGMWLLQNIRRDLNKSMSYDEMMYAAMESGKVSYIDVNAKEFVAPDNMTEAIRKYLGDENMPIGEVINAVYHSLARSYNDAVKEIEGLSGKEISAIHIVGGGCKDKYLDRLTSEYTGKTVTAGPVEATALGNLISQLIYSGECGGIDGARALVSSSFGIEKI